MFKRTGFLSNSSSSSFIVALPNGYAPNIDFILPEYIEVFRGHEGRVYTREEAYNLFLKFFHKVDVAKVTEMFEKEEEEDPSAVIDKEKFFVKYWNCDYYVCRVSGDNAILTDIEQRIFPSLADISISHH